LPHLHRAGRPRRPRRPARRVPPDLGPGATGATAARHSSAGALLGTSPKLTPAAELGANATVEPSSKSWAAVSPPGPGHRRRARPGARRAHARGAPGSASPPRFRQPASS